jgi:hypothetical protein
MVTPAQKLVITQAIILGGVVHYEPPRGTRSSRPRHLRNGMWVYLNPDEPLVTGTMMWCSIHLAAKNFVHRKLKEHQDDLRAAQP